MDPSSLLVTAPFRPIPVYGVQRPAHQVQPSSSLIPSPHFNPFLSCFRPTQVKLDPSAALECFYGATSQLASYHLALQEHMRRLQDARLAKTLDPRATLNSNILCPNTVVLNVPKSPQEAREPPSQINTESPSSKPEVSKESTSPRLPANTQSFESAFPVYNLGRKLFPCPNCRYTTDRRNNLKRHMLTMHQQCTKLLECCGIYFRTKASLREHAMIFHYHGYTCYYCGRRFCRKALLKRHLSVHNGQKDYVCSMCDYATSHKSNLERHKKVHQRPEEGQSMEEESDKMNGEISEGNEDISVCSDSEEEEEINVHSD